MKTTRRGILTLSPDQLDLALDNAAGSGFRTETHCIGDAALDMILGGLERRLAKELAAKRYRLTSALYRPVLTHVQIASRDLFRRIANLSDALGKRGCGPVICNVQVGQADFINAESDLKSQLLPLSTDHSFSPHPALILLCHSFHSAAIRQV